MKKTFTTEVPDRLYFPEISGKKTAKFTYDGPATIKVNIVDPNDPVYIADGMSYDENEPIIEVDASSDTKAAYMLLPNPITGDKYIFEDEVLVDGTVYKNRTNPSLHDYFKISYNTETNSFFYTPIQRFWKTENLIKAETLKLSIQTGMLERKNIDDGGDDAVKQFFADSGVDVSTLSSQEVVSILEDYISLLDQYISEENKIITWKFENGPPLNPIPEPPSILQKFF